MVLSAIQWGFGVDDTAEQLMIESEKAREYGKGYAYLTARNAAIAVEKRASSRATQSN